MAVLVTTTINGDTVEFACDAHESLLDVLRNRLGLSGAKEGCGTGDCGACSVQVDGRVIAREYNALCVGHGRQSRTRMWFAALDQKHAGASIVRGGRRVGRLSHSMPAFGEAATSSTMFPSGSCVNSPRQPTQSKS